MDLDTNEMCLRGVRRSRAGAASQHVDEKSEKKDTEHFAEVPVSFVDYFTASWQCHPFLIFTCIRFYRTTASWVQCRICGLMSVKTH